MEVDDEALSDEEGDITLTQETHVTTSVQGETNNADDPHVPATGAPQSTALPPSRPTTPPSASFEAAMANFATQENTQTTNPLTPPSASAEAALGAFATQPSLMPTQATSSSMAPRAATPEIPQVLVPGSPLSQPPSRAISQIPELPSRIHQILPPHKGKEKVTPNTLLAAIISAGGKAQDAMNENPSVSFALRIVGHVVTYPGKTRIFLIFGDLAVTA
ncbi:hypothetical protein FS749_011732 [Ceratobasidium sp. UAMH 11750]|nr:hypothetical protein FS749_011732 [Ceratobasidium sp. UAMH 11750]